MSVEMREKYQAPVVRDFGRLSGALVGGGPGADGDAGPS